MPEAPLLEIGRIGRPHGLNGEVTVGLVSNRPGRLVPGATLTLELAGSSARPIEVLTVRPHQGRYLVVFAGCSDRNGAERLRDGRLLAPAIADEDALFVHELIGSVVTDQHGVRRGVVTALEANPASDLLVIDDRFLVPLVFVVAHGAGTIEIDAPEGLFD